MCLHSLFFEHCNLILLVIIEPHVAPALQARAEDLKRSQLEDSLNIQLEHRPPVSELVEHHILHQESRLMAHSLQAHADELKRSQLEDILKTKLEHRPPISELVEHNILQEL
jgi:predicted metal-dependent hydrolase